ncbi:MAG: ABC transporter ATP-binding protein [Thermoanaerobaculaceae bacterium]|nr:ABC transporter ATP-binding protein [Thermoanaerobaculaceae bacterium]
MSLLALEGVAVEVGGRRILDLEWLEVEPGEIVAVLGPTGAGKSTLLRVAHLLERPLRGTVRWRGEAVGWPAPLELRRQIAMAFQDPLLFAGTVAENVGYGLEVRRVDGAERKRRVSALLELFGIASLAARRPASLSGGEAQRTALARALAPAPELLLLDEPLASLDEPIRQRLRSDLTTILRRHGVGCLWVTHDQAEALAVADRVAVLEGGRLAQVGRPSEVFYQPATPFVAGFVGTGNTLRGRVTAVREGIVSVDLGGVEVEAVADLPVGASVLACIRPEDVVLGRSGGATHHSARNRMTGKVLAVLPQGATTRVTVACGVRLEALVTRRSAEDLGLVSDLDVWLAVKATAVHLIAEAG